MDSIFNVEVGNLRNEWVFSLIEFFFLVEICGYQLLLVN